MDASGTKGSSSELPPDQRLRRLSALSNVNVDFGIKPLRYFMSGQQMVKMADTYMQEKKYEDAFVLYMKFITLFLEKIREHPDLKTVPVDIYKENKRKLKEVLPIAEELREKLLRIYGAEHRSYLLEREKLKEREEEIKRKEMEMAKITATSPPEYTPSHYGTRAVNTITSKIDSLRFKTKIEEIPAYDSLFPPSDKPELRPASLVHSKPTPTIDRSTKPVMNSFSDIVYYTGPKSVIIPIALMEKFLKIADKNTRNNIETCGILGGKMKINCFVITHVLIPKQYGTSDSCSTENEEDLFVYQNKYDLITIGWIHTHPSQTAFLSSVDLHTHCSYQLMLTEAIAIVCAPKYSETGFFRLTPDYGLDFIANCKQTGFHPHPSNPPLFQEAKHFQLDDTAPIEIVDLRT